MSNLKVLDADGNPIFLRGTGAGTSGDPMELHKRVRIIAEIPAGTQVIGRVGIDSSANIVGLSTANNTIKIDPANNTVALSSTGNIVRIDSNANQVRATVTAAENDIADGSVVTLGKVADAIVDAGDAGTISAKLRRLTKDLSDLLAELRIKADPNEAQCIYHSWTIEPLLTARTISSGDPNEIVSDTVSNLGWYTTASAAIIIDTNDITAGSLDLIFEQTHDQGQSWYPVAVVNLTSSSTNQVSRWGNTANLLRVRTLRKAGFAGNVTITVSVHMV